MMDVVWGQEGKPIPWASAAAASKGAFRSPPQRSTLAAHEAGLVSADEAELRDAIRFLIREAVEGGMSGGRARTAGMVGVAVETMALRQERENARFAARMKTKETE